MIDGNSILKEISIEKFWPFGLYILHLQITPS